MTKLKKNSLYEYTGGGYDGCFWEYNYFLVDSDNKWIDIFHSGCAGLKTEAEAIEYVNDASKAEEFTIYDLFEFSDMFDFSEKTSYNVLGKICNIINDYYKKDIAFYDCTYCIARVYPSGNDDYPSYFFDESNYRGAGGTHIEMGALICENCAGMTCDSCGSIVSVNDTPSFQINYDYLCEYCFNDVCEEILAGNKAITIKDFYPIEQVEMFNTFGRDKAIICDNDNREFVLDYLRQLGYNKE